MGTRIRDLASNTDSSIILDTGTSYIKRDDQTTPVYRGITSTSITGVGGWTWLNREQRDVAGVWNYPSASYWKEANVADWGIPVGATAVMFNYRWTGTTGEHVWCDWYSNDTQSSTGAPDSTAEGFHDRWLQFRDERNQSGQIVGWPTATGRCLFWRSDSGDGTLELYPIAYQMTAGTSATQTNLDAALARITELESDVATLESNTGSGGQFKVGTYSRSSTGRQTVDVGFQPKRIVWYHVMGTSNFTTTQVEWYAGAAAVIIHQDTSTNSGQMSSIAAGGTYGPTVTSTGFTTYHGSGGTWPTGLTIYYTAYA